MRTFVAIDLPANVKNCAADCQARLAEALAGGDTARAFRWSAIENLHLTLRFLGETSRQRVAQLGTTLARTASLHERLTLQIEDVGAFPNLRRPRVIWLGVSGDVARLQALQADIEAMAIDAGFEPETRRYSPHLTIGRARKGIANLELQRSGQIVGRIERDGQNSATAARPFSVTQIVHMASELRPDGPRYTQLSQASLG